MNNLSQPQPAEPDMALLYLGSLFETLHDIPEREDATLNALAGLILEEGPKTLLGLAIACRGEKWLRRQLWMVDFNILSPSDQAARVVIDSAMRIDCAQVLPSQEPADKRIASELLAAENRRLKDELRRVESALKVAAKVLQPYFEHLRNGAPRR